MCIYLTVYLISPTKIHFAQHKSNDLWYRLFYSYLLVQMAMCYWFYPWYIENVVRLVLAEYVSDSTYAKQTRVACN